jgi:hypothetical protein
MSIVRSERLPVQISQPDPQSKAIADRLHVAIFRGKLGAVVKLLDCGLIFLMNNFKSTT